MGRTTQMMDFCQILIRNTWNFSLGTWKIFNSKGRAGVLPVSPLPPVCPPLSSARCWSNYCQQTIDRSFFSRFKQPEGRSRWRSWGRSLHTKPSLITVRALPTVPSSPDNEFARCVIHAEVKWFGRSPFYLADLIDERRADLISVNLPTTNLSFHREYFLSLLLLLTFFIQDPSAAKALLCVLFFFFFCIPHSPPRPHHHHHQLTGWCLPWMSWLLDKASQLVSS